MVFEGNYDGEDDYYYYLIIIIILLFNNKQSEPMNIAHKQKNRN